MEEECGGASKRLKIVPGLTADECLTWRDVICSITVQHCEGTLPSVLPWDSPLEKGAVCR